MPTTLPVPTKNPGDLLTSALWNSYLRDNINKLLSRGHRVLTVAQFTALTGLEGTKGTVAPDEAYVEVDSANGIQWHVAYESGEATYKWRFIGGPPLYSEVATNEGTASTTYAALATAGPAIALPRAGDYDVEIGSYLSADTSSGQAPCMSYDIGGTGAVDADRVAGGTTAGPAASVHRPRRKAAVATSTLTAKYRSSVAGGTSYSSRYMRVTPVRIRHDA